ncbi:cytochrome b5-like heme/steroid binding domain-containing protein [Xylogone sp. PMI_703]|nr:cytochrome b5-like heme/steroid binding domain-containing protein [Xylogone sp. PMI_703]
MSKEYTLKEVASHSTREDLYVVIRNQVYNVTSFVDKHPGGDQTLLDVAGTDSTEAYDDAGHSEKANKILETYLIGTLKGPIYNKGIRLGMISGRFALSIIILFGAITLYIYV